MALLICPSVQNVSCKLVHVFCDYSDSFCYIQDNSKGEIPGAGIADVQLQLYNVQPDHHHALNNHSACINTPLPTVKIFENGSKQNGFSDEVCPHKHLLTTQLFYLQ